MDYLEELQKIEKANDQAKLQKATLEERLKNLKEEETKILKELEELGLKPEDLDKEIKTLSKQIEQELSKCQESMQS